jgi:uncharacterized repeat protein (TIGR02543 family)
VILNGNGGTPPAAPTGPVFSRTFTDGQVAFPGPATRTGYTFVGWFTARTGGSQVTATSDLGADGPKNILLYARWVPVQYTVTFDPQGGTNVAPQTVPFGGNAVLPTPPTLAGHIFNGWYTAPTGGNAWTFTTPISGDLTLYAQWTLATIGAPAPGDGSGGGDGATSSDPGGSSSGSGAHGSAAGGSSLASTGSDMAPWALAGIAALAIGAASAIAAAGRRRLLR